MSGHKRLYWIFGKILGLLSFPTRLQVHLSHDACRVPVQPKQIYAQLRNSTQLG